MGITITNSGQGSVVRFRNLGRGGVMTSTVTPRLLDAYPGAAAAYSLRKIRSGYTGPAVRVARSSDSSQIDIGFVNNALDTTTLLAFCGSGVDGFIATWYDQSGNGSDLVQTNKASMPLIVSAGSLILLNSKLTSLLNGAQTMETSAASFSSIQNTIIGVSKQTAVTSTYRRLISIGAYTSGYYLGTLPNVDDMLAIFNGSTFTCFGGTAINQNLSIAYNNPTTGFLLNNGVQVSSISTTMLVYGNQKLFLGTDSVGAGLEKWNGNIQEVIVYPTNQSANISGINTNINSYYTIY